MKIDHKLFNESHIVLESKAKKSTRSFPRISRISV